MLQCCLQKFAVGEILLHEEKIDRFSGCVKLFDVVLEMPRIDNTLTFIESFLSLKDLLIIRAETVLTIHKIKGLNAY